MVSRIDLGPDGGPYVELDEDAGEFIIRVPQDNVSFDGADLNSVGTASVTSLEAESVNTEELNTPTSGLVVGLDGEQILTDATIEEIEYEKVLTTRGVVDSTALDATENAIVVPEGFESARLHFGFEFGDDPELDLVFPKINDARPPIAPEFFWDQKDSPVGRRWHASTPFFDVSQGDEIKLEVRQSSGEDDNLRDDPQTFLEVWFI